MTNVTIGETPGKFSLFSADRERGTYIGQIMLGGEPLSDYRIVVSDGCSACFRDAADELSFYIKLVCGVELAIVTDRELSVEHEILLGRTNRGEEEPPLPSEGFTLKMTGKRLCLVADCDRGIQYAVSEFLDRYIGIRFLVGKTYEIYQDGLWRIDENKVLRSEVYGVFEAEYVEIPSTLYDRQIPTLTFRDMEWICAFDSDWSVKQRLNSGANGRRHLSHHKGGGIDYAGTYVHSLFELAEMTPDQRSGQPCFSDETILNKVIKNAKVWLADHPTASYISISQNDNENKCTCPACMAVAEEEGSYAGVMLRFVNRVAEAIREEYPKVEVVGLAYQFTRTPPKITRPANNVTIMLCPIECCFFHPIYDKTCEFSGTFGNKRFSQDFEGWSRIAERLFIFDYNTNYTCFLATDPNFETMPVNMRYYAERHVKGMFICGNFMSHSGEFGELRAYLLAKLMWNPYMSPEEYHRHMDDFLMGYYGAGWRAIKRYMYRIMTEVAQDHMFSYYEAARFLSRERFLETLPETEADWDEALRLTGNEVQRQNVERSRLQVEYLKVQFQFDDWSEEERIAQNRAFYRKLVKNGIEYVRIDRRLLPEKEMDFTVSPTNWMNPKS